MKNIIVPTDFSVPAKTALRYAINIANHYQSNVHLVHVYKVRTASGTFVSMRDFMKKDAEEQLADVLKEFGNSLMQGAELKGKAVEGYPVDTICNYAKSADADLIVMGTQGASGLKEIFLGSNTSGVLQKTTIPVLAIPENFEYHKFKNIILAVDSLNLKTSELVKPLMGLASSFKAKVHVLHLEPAPVGVGIDPNLGTYLQGVPHDFYQENMKGDMNDGINAFVAKQEADLLCMIRRKRSFIDKLFHVSVTEKEVFNSPVPLLVLPEIGTV